MRKQLDELEYAHTGFFTTEAAERLGDDLVAHAPEGDGRNVYFVSGGSGGDRGRLERWRGNISSRSASRSAPGLHRPQAELSRQIHSARWRWAANEWRRAQFEPLLVKTHHVSRPPHPPAGPPPPRPPPRPPPPARPMPIATVAPTRATRNTGERLAQELEAMIAELGPETIIGFIAETVGGATAGAPHRAPEGYYPARARDL